MAHTLYFESKFRTWNVDVKYLKFQLPDGTEFLLSEEWITASGGKKRTGMQRLIFLKRNNYDYSYRVTVEVSSSRNKASGEILLMRKTNPQRTSIIILLSDFQKLSYPVQQTVLLQEVEVSERFISDILKYKVTVIPIDEPESETEITCKRDQILIMSDQLNSLLHTGDFADITITDSKSRCTIKAHRNILDARSVYFRCMFQSNWKENKENSIVFHDREDKELLAIREMLYYIYTGVVRPMKVSDMLYLYMTADQFLLDDLKKFLSVELQKRLNIENAVVIYILAGCVFDTHLRESSLVVIRHNFQRVHNTQFWRALQKPEGKYSRLQGFLEITSRISEIINGRDN